jgi:hypothetical protein
MNLFQKAAAKSSSRPPTVKYKERIMLFILTAPTELQFENKIKE